MKRILCIVWMVVLAWTGLYPEPPDLSVAVKAALGQNPQRQNLLIDARIKEIDIARARARRRFESVFSGAYRYRSQALEIDFQEATGLPGLPGGPVELGSRHQVDAALSLHQPIFLGGTLRNNLRREELIRRSLESEVAAQENRIRLEVKGSYFRYWIMINNRERLEKSIQNLDYHIHKIGEQVKDELARRTDLLEARNRKGELQLQKIEVEDKIEQEKVFFSRICGMDLAEIRPGYREPEWEMARAISHFEGHHPTLDWFDRQIDLIAVQEKTVRGQYLPRLKGFFDLHYGRPGINIFLDRWSWYCQTGIALDLTVFAWGKKSKELRQLQFRRDKLINRRRAFQEETLEKIHRQYITLKKLREKVELVGTLEDNASREARLKYQLYQEQQIDHAAYMDALFKRDAYGLLKQRLLTEIELTKVTISHLVHGSR